MLNSSFNVKLVQDTCDKIILRGVESNIETVNMDQQGNWIHIHDKIGRDFFRGEKQIPELQIHAKNIDTLEIREFCNIKSANTLYYSYFSILFRADIGTCNINVRNRQLRLSAWSTSGHYILKGISDFVSLSVTGASVIDADSLTASCLWVVQNSTNNMKANVKDSMSVYITNSGNLILRTKPDRTFEQYLLGTGNIYFKSTK